MNIQLTLGKSLFDLSVIFLSITASGQGNTGHHYTTGNSDPYTSQQIKQDGHYSHWYTDEFGEYQGSDDPSYDPNRYGGGNWQPIQLTRPDH